jgi:hypothetical protein
MRNVALAAVLLLAQDLDQAKTATGNETTLRAPIWRVGKPQVLEVAVHKTVVAVTLAGKRIMDWKGPPSQCPLYEGWKLSQKNRMMLGSWNAQRLLTPVSEQGRKLR